jgi:hypothetical protein
LLSGVIEQACAKSNLPAQPKRLSRGLNRHE